MAISLSSLNAAPVYGRDGRVGSIITDDLSWSDDRPVLARPSDRFRVFYDAYYETGIVERKTRFGWKRVPELEVRLEQNGYDWLQQAIVSTGATFIVGNWQKSGYQLSDI